MAKKGPSKHSRAARRATSPSINTDKSLKAVKPPSESVNRRPSILGIHHAAGVSKKAKRGRKAILSSKARRRQEREMDRAEAVLERTSQKMQKSKAQARTIQSRRKTWDEVNKVSRESGKKEKSAAQPDPEQEAVAAIFQDTDEEMGEAEAQDSPTAPTNPHVQIDSSKDFSPPPPGDGDDGDEIL